MANDNAYNTPLPLGQTTANAESVDDTAIMVWQQMGLSTAQIMYGIAMMTIESGDTPTVTNGNSGETIRGLGQTSDGTWDVDAGEVNGTYELSPGSSWYIPQNLNPYTPTNANFNPGQPADTNAQSGESNDPGAGQYDPEGLVEQLEVVGQGIENEWNVATDALSGASPGAQKGLSALINSGVAGSSYFNSSETSTLLATVALAYLAHHEGTGWWIQGTLKNYLRATEGDLNDPNGKLVAAIQEVVSAFKDEYGYLADNSGSQSVISSVSSSEVTEAQLNDVSASTLLVGDPWVLAGATPSLSDGLAPDVITHDIPSMFDTLDNFYSQTVDGLSSYVETNSWKTISYSYTTKATGANDVISGSATYNYNTDSGSGEETFGNGSVVTYSETDSPQSGWSLSATTTNSVGTVTATETATAHVINGEEIASYVFNAGQANQYGLVDYFNLA